MAFIMSYGEDSADWIYCYLALVDAARAVEVRLNFTKS